jgi:hypothetical protein
VKRRFHEKQIHIFYWVSWHRFFAPSFARRCLIRQSSNNHWYLRTSDCWWSPHPVHMGIIDNAPATWIMTDPFNNYDNEVTIEIRGSTSQMYPRNPTHSLLLIHSEIMSMLLFSHFRGERLDPVCTVSWQNPAAQYTGISSV